ncbi:MAG: GDSL-type esterase/lipase family protein [Massiliimalia sp.]|jgi:lysophospholipase L1-like esterase
MPEWKSSWAYCSQDLNMMDMTVENETQRIFVRNNLQGRKLRLRFSNRYGSVPMIFERVVVARAWEGKLVPATDRTVLFDGKEKLVLAPGQERWSDELGFSVVQEEDLAISTYVKEPMLVSCGSSSISRTLVDVKNSWAGDFCNVREFSVRPQEEYLSYVRGSAPENQPVFFYGLSGVDVLTDVSAATIAAFGDSITHQSHWCGHLAQRLYHHFTGEVSVINCGIGGNRILHDAAYPETASYGEAGIRRFKRDVFEHRAVDLVLVLEGVNDLFHPFDCAPRSEEVTAEQMIDGLIRFAEIAHNNGAKIIGCTILPFRDERWKWSEKMEQKRLQVNQWILNNEIYDGALDFASMVQDPDDPTKLKDEFHCGDKLHPSEAGGRQIAEQIDLDWLMHMALCK